MVNQHQASRPCPEFCNDHVARARRLGSALEETFSGKLGPERQPARMARALVALAVPATQLGAALPNSALAPEAEMQPAAAKELAFIHIPKTGGTSIEEAGAQVGFSWGKHFNFSATNTQSSACGSLYHVPPGMLETHLYAAFDTFCAKRHPYTRAISQYLFWTVATDPGCHGEDPCGLPRDSLSCVQRGRAQRIHRRGHRTDPRGSAGHTGAVGAR